MLNPRAVIAEDEPLLAQALVAALRNAWPELGIAAIAGNGVEALDRLVALAPEVAFLDIRMPGLTGLEVASELADRAEDGARVPRIVFVTAFDEFALQAFDLAAVDYLLKPLDPMRLARTVERLKAQLATPAEGVAQLAARLSQVLAMPPVPATPPLNVIRAGAGHTVRMIPVDEVVYFQATDKYVTVVTADAELLIRLSLKELLAQLPAGRFRQVHRGTIVNLAEVESARRDDSGRLHLRLRRRPESLPVSRVFADHFRPM